MTESWNPTDIPAMRQRLADIVIEKSFQYREDPPFKLVSGRTSPFYFNCKPTALDPEGMNLIGRILFAMVHADITAGGGLTLGADPLANALALISYQLGRPIRAFIVRKEVKNHGTGSAIEGSVKMGEKVLILDDVITTGGSTITAIEKARQAGLQVVQVITLIDREEGGRENIIRDGKVDTVSSVLKRSEIMARYNDISRRNIP